MTKKMYNGYCTSCGVATPWEETWDHREYIEGVLHTRPICEECYFDEIRQRNGLKPIRRKPKPIKKKTEKTGFGKNYKCDGQLSFDFTKKG